MKYAINQDNTLIVGASQGIGLGFVKKLLQDGRSAQIYATYRCQESAAELLSAALAITNSVGGTAIAPQKPP